VQYEPGLNRFDASVFFPQVLLSGPQPLRAFAIPIESGRRSNLLLLRFGVPPFFKHYISLEQQSFPFFV
jgi:hypothetical protein